MRTVLFYRDFKWLTGGDLKVWDYFNHVLSSPDHTAYVRFSSGSAWDEGNPWSALKAHVVKEDGRVDADMRFLSGVDWLELEPDEREDSRLPIINLVQHVWHACPNDPLGRYHFLTHKAIRICVSPQITRALAATGRVRGPLFTIPDAIDFESIVRLRRARKDVDLLIVGNKALPPRPGTPAAPGKLGPKLKARLERRGRSIHLIERRIARGELLDWLSRSTVTLFLPNRKEGFYLPALEGMALETIVVCPDCIGNRSFCLPGENCFRPEYVEDELVEAVDTALRNPEALSDMVERASLTAQKHRLSVERKAFLEILTAADELWSSL